MWKYDHQLDDRVLEEREADRHQSQAPASMQDAADGLGADSGQVRSLSYVWDIRSGTFDWDEEVGALLGIDNESLPRTIEALNALITNEHVARRVRNLNFASVRDTGNGVPYRFFMRMRPCGYRSPGVVWVEEVGRWWADSRGRPIRAHGALRVGIPVSLEAKRQAVVDYDELTGQLSRARLTDTLEAVLGRPQEPGRPSAFLLVSVNGLQRINDQFGYRTGDALLATVGKRLEGVLRGGDTIGRYASNKFGLVIADCLPEGAARIGQRFVDDVTASPILANGCSIVPDVSVGVVLLDEPSMSVDDAAGKALRALEARRSHASRSVFVYEQDHAGELGRTRRAEIGERVTSAIAEERLKLLMQPIIETATGEVGFHECLLRIENPGEENCPASDFIPVAEWLGLASVIDRKTLGLAADLLAAHRSLNVSLNISALTCTDPAWLRALTEVYDTRPDVCQRLIVEITETMTATDADEAAYFVDAVRELGCRVAIDDFGAGHTSFVTLRQLTADMLKIDGQFVRDLKKNGRDHVLVRTMIQMARDLGMVSVAEWVSDQETAELVADMGADYIQGFHYGAPMSINDALGYAKRAETQPARLRAQAAMQRRKTVPGNALA